MGGGRKRTTENQNDVIGTYLILSPRALVDSGVQTVIPPLPALVPVACADIISNLAPSWPVDFDGFTEFVVFFSCPGAFSDNMCHAIMPAFSAVLVVASRKMRRYSTPANSAIGRGLCC